MIALESISECGTEHLVRDALVHLYFADVWVIVWLLLERPRFQFKCAITQRCIMYLFHIELGDMTSKEYHSAGKHDRGPLFFTLFSFRLIRSRSTGSI